MTETLDKAAAFRRADKAWDEALAVVFGRGACDARYSAKGAGPAGSALRRIYSDRFRAYAAWCEACGMIPGTDPLVEPLPAPHPDYDTAVAYEAGHVVEDGELTYATRADLEAAVTAALAAGWRLDVLCAHLDEWPWYRLAAQGEASAMVRDGEWRFYVETAAEALAEMGDADQLSLVEA